MMIIASQNQMKIFRYKLRNGNFIDLRTATKKHKTHTNIDLRTATKKHKTQTNRSFLCLLRSSLCLFVASFRFLRRRTVDVADAANGLDSFEIVQLMAQLLAQVTHVHVDAAIE